MRDWARRHFLNHRGWRAPGRYLVLQSDDWGSVRTTSLEALEALRQSGVDTAACHYLSNDALATDEDLVALFETLQSVRDRDGHPAVLSPNVLTHNPDVATIVASGFATYAALTLEETFDALKARDDRYRGGLSLWQEGISAGLFAPQLHGAEHVHVGRWLRALREGNPVVRIAADFGMWGVSRKTSPYIGKSLQAALDDDSPEDATLSQTRLADACKAFETRFGRPSASFTTPNYTWSSGHEAVLWAHGTRAVQSFTRQWSPQGTPPNPRRIFSGDRSPVGLTYIQRNVHFEPSENPRVDGVERAMKEIHTAFNWHRPAVISTHRVNYVGALHLENRSRGLVQLGRLLRAVTDRWPDVQFISTESLVERMEGRIAAFTRAHRS